MEKLFGIDISHWQGDMSIEQARNERGVRFAIIKAAGADDGKYKDSKFENYYAQCKAIGLPVGAYYYGNAKSVTEAEQEADHFLSVIAGKAYGFSMEAVGSKKFIAQEREAFLDFTEEKVSKAAMKLSGNDARAEVHSQEVRNRENAEHGEDLVTMTHKTTQPISLEWIQEVVRLGRARDYFSEGDTIDIEFDGEVIQHDIIGIDAEKLVDKSLEHSITIQMHDLVMEERPFDTTGDYGSNVWETSELRKYLHSEEFRERYKKLIPYLTKVVKENNSGDDTEDLFFLLSADEVDPKKTPYKYYEDVTNRQKKNADGETDYHRLRSANRGNSCDAWCVYSSGNVYGGYYANWAHRCAPACTIE